MESYVKTSAPDAISPLVDVGVQVEQVLRAAWESVPDALIVFDTRQQIFFANAEAARALTARGLPLDAPGLCRSLKVFDSEKQILLKSGQLPVARALRGETIDRVEYLVSPAPYGISLWVECGARPFYDKAGEVRGAVVVFRDVTESKKKELTAQATGQLRDFIYQNNFAGILHDTVDGRILACNDALVRMLGFDSTEELRGYRVPQLYYEPTERDRLIRRLSVSREVREAEVCLRRRDNSRCWVLINVRLLEPPPGQIGGTLVSTIVDITERKRWEETLRQSQQRFAAFMRHLPGVAFIKDPRGRYVYHNEACRVQFGRYSDDFIGKTDEDIWPPEDAERHRLSDARVINGGAPVECVSTVLQEDGPHFWLIHKFPIVEDGKVVLVGGIGIDITERRTLEEQLTQARKMEALGRLAGGVAHDFNNLLTVISGYGQLALETLESSSSDRLGMYMKEILNSARRASGMTGQLLAFSRRQTVQPRVIDLGDLLRNMQRLLQKMIGEHVELKVHCHDSSLVLADVHQMEQVLMNLAVNARDAMPLGGTLEIRCGLLPEPLVRPNQPPLSVLLEVRDDGVGMDDSVKAQLFEPFFTSKEKGRGTGLGLSTVYGVISQAGGEIEVDSELGEGTRFRIYLPLAAGDVEERPALSPGATPVGLETVLLVEDDPNVRVLAETVLKGLGYKVLVAAGGDDAIGLWDGQGGRIDILLTDVIMPQMSGNELANQLRAKNPRLKVLFMSGYTDAMISDHGVLAGETQLIQKPFTPEVLGRKLRGILDA